MFVHPGAQLHVLMPRAYFSAEFHARESERIFSTQWHLAALAKDLGQPNMFVARHIHNPSNPAGAQVERSEVQIDGDLSPLLFLKAVHGLAGQGAHEGGLAVVDMARGTDNHAATQGR